MEIKIGCGPWNVVLYIKTSTSIFDTPIDQAGVEAASRTRKSYEGHRRLCLELAIICYNLMAVWLPWDSKKELCVI